MVDINEDEIENEINEKGLNAPRLTPKKIDSVIKDVSYTMLPSKKSLICEITLINGFTVRGDSAVVSKENFDLDLGKKISYASARDKIWAFEAYLLQQKLYENKQ